jgi:hypothetical protein
MDVVIREATEADIPELARVHVRAWNATCPHAYAPPSAGLRERQWRAGFASAGERPWFCFVAQADGAMAGFAQGNAYASAGPAALCRAAEQDLPAARAPAHGDRAAAGGAGGAAVPGAGDHVHAAVGEADNVPACRFYASLGGEPLRDAEGRPSPGDYGWRDVRALAALCAGG